MGCGATDTDSSGPRSPERQSSAEYDLAKDYFYKGQPRAALDHIRRAVDLQDDNSKALYFASIIYMSFCAGDTGFQSPDCNLVEAEKYARLALKAQEDFRDARNALGQILIDEGKFPEAIQTLTPLVKDPAYSAAHLAWGNLGWAQVKLGDVDAGITSLKNAIATDPQFCVGHYRLGRAYEKKGDLPHAEESFTNALNVENEACKKLQDAYEGRAGVRVKLRNIDGARDDYSKCKDLLPTSKAGQSCTRMLADLASPQSQ
jgi:Tfp pilus assembly protein PilF